MPSILPEAERSISAFDQLNCVPTYVVWELTLACNLKCRHCGSRAGSARLAELSTDECLGIVHRLAELGTREVTIIGGEAFLRKDWLAIVAEIKKRGMLCTLQTGGYGVTEVLLGRAFEAGLGAVGVSIDGLEELHDSVRGVRGSYKSAMSALKAAKDVGLLTSVNTQVGPRTLLDLSSLMAEIAAAGVTAWQIQLTVAMGNAVDNDEVLLQPHQILELMPLLARLAQSELGKSVSIVPGNNIGYFGPYEVLWRGPERGSHYAGCPAGQNVLGIEADGTVKACPSLATSRFAAGNVRTITIDQIWRLSNELKFNRQRSTDHLWGYCAECYYADVCRGGCTWTADSLLGKSGNNPYCHYRALQFARRGLQERIVKVQDATSESFATGRFRIVEEPLDDKYSDLFGMGVPYGVT